MRVEDPDEISIALTLTMTLKQWRALRDQIPNAYPSWDLANAISDAIRKVDRVFGVDVQSVAEPARGYLPGDSADIPPR